MREFSPSCAAPPIVSVHTSGLMPSETSGMRTIANRAHGEVGAGLEYSAPFPSFNECDRPLAQDPTHPARQKSSVSAVCSSMPTTTAPSESGGQKCLQPGLADVAPARVEIRPALRVVPVGDAGDPESEGAEAGLAPVSSVGPRRPCISRRSEPPSRQWLWRRCWQTSGTRRGGDAPASCPMRTLPVRWRTA